MKKNIATAAFIITSALALSGCIAPVVVGGITTVGTLATREKGVTGTLSDSQLSVIIKADLYDYNPDAHARINVNVQNAEVLLTGNVQNQEWQIEAERIAWKPKGVKKVLNNIEIIDNDDLNLGDNTRDSWITTQIKSSLLFGDDIRSLNYSIKTANAVVYVMGIAQDQTELDKVLDIASKTSYVKRVVNYVKLNDEPS